LKAGTAQKMVLNMITTASMIRLGKVYGNLKVNVQATNQKLRDRAVRTIMEATGADFQTATTTSDLAGGDVRAAVLMIKYQIGLDEALAALQSSSGHFGEAIDWLETS
jgi:N-acetylmuramic acid 6-phosphate etherase